MTRCDFINHKILHVPSLPETFVGKQNVLESAIRMSLRALSRAIRKSLSPYLEFLTCHKLWARFSFARCKSSERFPQP